jgi:hypothetical protein
MVFELDQEPSVLCKLELETAYVLNHHLSQKLKLIGMDEFNHLIYILILLFTFGLKLLFNK